MEHLEKHMDYVRFLIKKCPEHKDEIVGFVELAQTEIEDGESADHEVELMCDSLEDLTSISYQDYRKQTGR